MAALYSLPRIGTEFGLVSLIPCIPNIKVQVSPLASLFPPLVSDGTRTA